jgi:hypothetical protein
VTTERQRAATEDRGRGGYRGSNRGSGGNGGDRGSGRGSRCDEGGRGDGRGGMVAEEQCGGRGGEAARLLRGDVPRVQPLVPRMQFSAICLYVLRLCAHI